ncbi:MAG: hypothetical protein MJK04_22135, partial [Psychrosphaera sp.]|nr:hypothetical protein [Psychrosphaera sp.]
REEAILLATQTSSLYMLYHFDSLDDNLKAILATEYISVLVTLVLAVITLVLSYVGLYGILSYATHNRRFEIGIRLSIGAKRRQLVNLIIKDNSRPMIGGVIASALLLAGLFVYLNGQYQAQIDGYLNAQLLLVYLVTLSCITLICAGSCYFPLRQYINRPAIYSLKVTK